MDLIVFYLNFNNNNYNNRYNIIVFNNTRYQTMLLL